MASTKKTWTEKLNTTHDLPKIEKLSGKAAERLKASSMYIPSPAEIDEMMKKVKKGKLTSINHIREKLSLAHGTDITCPITTGIFSWIAAHASEEQQNAGKKRVTPYWRTLKQGGVINPKYPGGESLQKQILESEGFTVVKKGKNWVVENYEKYLV